MTLEGEQQPLLADRSEENTNDEEELEKTLLRELDSRMSILVLIFILNYIDRNNIAAARLRGFEHDLKLEGNQFASLLSIMYVGYMLMQIPSNMFLNYFGKPSLYLPACMVLWGGTTICTGFVTSFWQALCARFLLGFIEAAFFPGALFLLSKWYKRNELSTRVALLICGTFISNAFGSLIASAILGFVDNWLGYATWRWLFFVEGGMTIVVAAMAVYILPDFPENSSSWLSPRKRYLAQKRIIEDTGLETAVTMTSAKEEVLNGFVLALSDQKVWQLAFAMATLTATLSFGVYFPTLTATFGYNTTITLLLCAPPWIFASITSLFLSIHSDKVQERFWHITLPMCLACLGFFVSMLTMNTLVRYVAFFLITQTCAGLVCFLAWVGGSVPHSTSKRAVAIAFINSFGQLGITLGVYTWPSSWGPSYYKSYALGIAASAVFIFMCYMYRRELAWHNRRIDMGLTEGMNAFKYLL